MKNNSIITPILIISFLFPISNLYGATNIDTNKEAAICIEILELSNKNNLRERLKLKELSKETHFKEVISCVKTLVNLKSENRWNTCMEKFKVNVNYKQGDNHQTDKILQKCMLEKW